MEPSKRIQSDFAEGPCTAVLAETVIGLLAFALSIALGIMVGLLTRESALGAVCAIAVFEVVVWGAVWFAETLAEKPSRKEAQVSGQRPDQQAHLGGDAVKSIEPHVSRGVATVRRAPKKPAEALADDDRETKLQPENPEALYGRGITLFELRRHEEALQSFDEAISIKAAYPEAWYDRGLYLLELGRPDEGVVAFEQAMRLPGRI